MSSNPNKKWERRQAAAKKRADLRRKAVIHMGGCCRICGYNRCLAALDFHHLDPAQKEFNISSVMSWPRIMMELNKCELLCSNCHREVHDGMHPEYLEDSFEPYGYDSV